MLEKIYREKIYYFKIYRKQDFKELGEHYQYTSTIKKECKKRLEAQYQCPILSRLHIVYSAHQKICAEDFLLGAKIDKEEKSEEYYVEGIE